MRFEFNTNAQARCFMKRLRKNFILSEPISEHVVQIHAFELIRDEMKPIVQATAGRIYKNIMG